MIEDGRVSSLRQRKRGWILEHRSLDGSTEEVDVLLEDRLIFASPDCVPVTGI